jgi:hypothetical protein
MFVTRAILSEKSSGKPAAQPHPVLKDAGQARAAEREARRAAALRANLTRRKAQTRAREAGDAPESASLPPHGHGADPKA